MKNLIRNEIQKLKDRGAEYVDCRYYPFELTNEIFSWNSNIMANSNSFTSGFGVRVLYDGAWGFAADTDLLNLTNTFEKAFLNAKTASERIAFKVKLAPKEVIKDSFSSPSLIDPFSVDIKEKLEFINKMDKVLTSEKIDQRIVSLTFMKKQIIFMDSEGSEIEKNITEAFPSIRVGGVDKDGGNQTRSFSPGRRGKTRGYESLDKELFEKEGTRIVSELKQVLEADDCPTGNRSVILKPGIMFLQTHETIGHALELDRILGYELSFAGGSFVRLEDFGKLKYGSDKLTVRADATLENSPGSFGYDDDGVKASNNLLIDKGILVGAITSRQMVMEANEKAGRQIFTGSSGANRSTAFNKAPIERMTNINIDPGKDGSLEDIIKNTEKGIVLDGEKSWSIGSNREQFHFSNHIGWLVEDGRITKVVKNPSYRGETLKFYNSLSAVGDESTWEVAYVENCGKGSPNQIMQLGHGVPVCKFEDVVVGE